jgi:MYXO-CTERM domain-containing protein
VEHPLRIDDPRVDGAGSVVFNTGAAVRPGVIDVAWLQKDTGSLASNDGQWYPWFAQIENADTPSPHVVGKQRMTDTPNHAGGVCIQGILCGVAPGSSDRSLADFFELGVNPKTGMAEIAYAQNAHNRPSDPGPKNGEVVFAKQSAQPALEPGPALPESPYLPLLPLAAVAALGGAFVWRRRRMVQI